MNRPIGDGRLPAALDPRAVAGSNILARLLGSLRQASGPSPARNARTTGATSRARLIRNRCPSSMT